MPPSSNWSRPTGTIVLKAYNSINIRTLIELSHSHGLVVRDVDSRPRGCELELLESASWPCIGVHVKKLNNM